MTAHIALSDDERAELDAKVAELLPNSLIDAVTKKLENEMSGCWEYALDMIQEDTQDAIAREAANAASSLVMRMLDGEEVAARVILDCIVKHPPYDTRKYHSIIHGRLSETAGIALRRKLIEAHSDFLMDQRVLDLEELVANLRKDIDQKDEFIRRLRDGLR